jgi:hypothetical protein
VHADGWILTVKLAFSWLWVLSVSRASLVPPAAGNAGRWARRIHLIIDNCSSHTSEETTEFFEYRKPRVHVLFTPINASWLNQAEALLEALSTRYLIRGSWCSRARMVKHIIGSKQEYNQRYAHPFSATHILSTGSGPVAISAIGSITRLD